MKLKLKFAIKPLAKNDMEHPGEIWQEADFNGERIGGIVPTELDLDKVKLFIGTAVMLYRYKDDEVEYLFQHRSKLLKGNPDKWDVSAGGHVNLNERRTDSAVRETKEEIGATIDGDKLEFAAAYLRWKVLVILYFYDWTGKEDNFHFDDQEVEEVKWVKYKDIKAFSPNFKPGFMDDVVFLYYLKEWTAKIIKKYENH